MLPGNKPYASRGQPLKLGQKYLQNPAKQAPPVSKTHATVGGSREGRSFLKGGQDRRPRAHATGGRCWDLLVEAGRCQWPKPAKFQGGLDCANGRSLQSSNEKNTRGGLDNANGRACRVPEGSNFTRKLGHSWVGSTSTTFLSLQGQREPIVAEKESVSDFCLS